MRTYSHKNFFTLTLLLILILLLNPLTTVLAGSFSWSSIDTNKIQNASYVSSGDDLLDYKPIIPPTPHSIKGAEGHTTKVSFNMATRKQATIQRTKQTQVQIDSETTYTEPYESLLQPDFNPETVIPPDDRTLVPYSTTTTSPWSSICKLLITAADGTHWMGSGAIIGPGQDGHGYHILTAGHCVYMHDHGGWASSIQVIPGYDGAQTEVYQQMPYYCAWVTDVHTYDGWTVDEDYRHDWAVCKLDRCIGDYTGWMGRMTDSPSSSIYTAGVLSTAGYPADINNGNRMYYDSDNGYAADEYNHYYYMDTYGGQSGSPVWYDDGSSRYILTIHAYGATGINFGTRLNQEKFDDINTWLSSDDPPIDKPDLCDDGQTYSSFSPTTVIPDETSFLVECNVRNFGTSAASNFYVSYYASTDPTITSSDYLIGTYLIPSLSQFSYADSLWSDIFPEDIPAGTYWVGWIIDSDNSISEFDETNNIVYKHSYQLVVQAPQNTVTFKTNPIEFVASPGTVTCWDSTYSNGETENFPDGTYQATANAPTDYQFHHWEYSGSAENGVYVPNISTNPTSVQINGDGWLKAVFSAKIAFYTTAPGSGSITWDSGPTYTYEETRWEVNLPPDFDNTVSITANPPTTHEFNSWSKSGMLDVENTLSNPTILTVNGPGSITANWEASSPDYTLTTNIIGDGSVTLDPDQSSYTYDDVVSLTAVADEGWTFTGWSGDLSGDVNPESITMDDNKIVTATFNSITPTVGFTLDDLTAWYWTDNTIIKVINEGDVDNDGSTEIVTGGYYFDGERDVAQLIVWDGATLSVKNIATWYWTSDTRINSIAIGNLDEDEALEIVTGGFFYDGARKVSQLVIWDGSALTVDGLTTWYWTSDTEINSVKVEDIDGDGSTEIITGGYYNDGERDVAQLVVWDGPPFTVENLVVWYWSSDTRINSIDVENVDGDSQMEIITGGYYTDVQKIAQLVVWDGINLSPENIATWYWISDTDIISVVAANVDNDNDIEIVTGGYYNDNSRDIAQLVIWNNNLQTVENLSTWYWTGDTRIESICVGDPDSDEMPEIITGGYYNDLTRDVAQLVAWDGTTLTVDDLSTWYWTDNTRIFSVALGNIDSDLPSEIITGGYFHDNTRNCAQTTIWELGSQYEGEPVQVGIYPSGGVNIWDYESELNVEFNHILHYQKIKSLDYTKVVRYLDLDYEVILVLIFEDTYANLQAITNGEYDSYLINLSEDIRNDGRTIWLRPLHEFNGDWYNWGALYPGNTIADFIPAWKHIVQLFRDLNTPVKFQLNYNRYNGLGDTTPFSAFWPGDDYVDMAVITNYNRAYTDEWHQYWHTFAEDFDNAYNQITSLTEKPIGIAEMSSTSYGGDKPQWIIDAFNSIAYDYPRVQQVSWFLTNKLVSDVLWDWDLNTQEEKDAFVQGMQLISTIRR